MIPDEFFDGNGGLLYYEPMLRVVELHRGPGFGLDPGKAICRDVWSGDFWQIEPENLHPLRKDKPKFKLGQTVHAPQLTGYGMRGKITKPPRWTNRRGWMIRVKFDSGLERTFPESYFAKV